MSVDPKTNQPPLIEKRLFPIPGLVVYPGVVQGLHVFEPRYRALMKASLAEDQTFVLATPVESSSGGEPPLASMGCLVKILEHECLPDGKYNVKVVGVSRVRLVQELPAVDGYRRAMIEPIMEIPVDATCAKLQQVHVELLTMFEELLGQSGLDVASLTSEMKARMPLSQLSHLIGFVIPFPVAWKLELLAQPNALLRARRLLEMRRLLSDEGPAAAGSPYPPEFSVN